MPQARTLAPVLVGPEQENLFGILPMEITSIMVKMIANTHKQRSCMLG